MSGAEPLMIAALAGGTALEYAGQRRAAKDRRGILNRAFEDNKRSAERATALVQGEGANFQPDARRAAFDAQEAAALEQATKDLQGATGGQGATLNTAGDAGNVSSDFIAAKADRALAEGNRMTAIARELAKTRAPGLAQQNESMRAADTMQRVGSVWGDARARGEAAQMDAQNVQEPWWGTLGKIAKSAATAYGTNGASLGR